MRMLKRRGECDQPRQNRSNGSDTVRGKEKGVAKRNGGERDCCLVSILMEGDVLDLRLCHDLLTSSSFIEQVWSTNRGVLSNCLQLGIGSGLLEYMIKHFLCILHL